MAWRKVLPRIGFVKREAMNPGFFPQITRIYTDTSVDPELKRFLIRAHQRNPRQK
jgi:hypothetical protein